MENQLKPKNIFAVDKFSNSGIVTWFLAWSRGFWHGHVVSQYRDFKVHFLEDVTCYNKSSNPHHRYNSVLYYRNIVYLLNTSGEL